MDDNSEKVKADARKPIAVFDLEGTLVETDDANSAAYRTVLHGCGYGEVCGFYGRITAGAIRAAITGISDVEVNEIVRAKVDAYCHELWQIGNWMILQVEILLDAVATVATKLSGVKPTHSYA